MKRRGRIFGIWRLSRVLVLSVSHLFRQIPVNSSAHGRFSVHRTSRCEFQRMSFQNLYTQFDRSLSALDRLCVGNTLFTNRVSLPSLKWSIIRKAADVSSQIGCSRVSRASQLQHWRSGDSFLIHVVSLSLPLITKAEKRRRLGSLLGLGTNFLQEHLYQWVRKESVAVKSAF